MHLVTGFYASSEMLDELNETVADEQRRSVHRVTRSSVIRAFIRDGLAARKAATRCTQVAGEASHG